MFRSRALFAAALLSLCTLPALAAPLVGQLSFDSLNAAALNHYPDSVLSDIAVQSAADGSLLYRVELLDTRGHRRELVLDARSGSLLQEKERNQGGNAGLPSGLVPGSRLPSFDGLNEVAFKRYPGSLVDRASLRRINDGRLLYNMWLTDASGVQRQLVIDAGNSNVLTDRKI